MKEFGLNSLHYVSLPDYSFDFWLMSSGVTLDTLQYKQMLDDFVEAKRGGIWGIVVDSLVNNRRSRLGNQGQSPSSVSGINNTLWYVDANNLYGCAMCITKLLVRTLSILLPDL